MRKIHGGERVRIKSLEDSERIKDKKNVKITQMNHLVEIMDILNVNRDGLPVVKLSKDEYLNIITGEVFDCSHTTTRDQNKDSVRATFKKLRYLINNNFTGAGNELMFTLTYAENMTDLKRLYTDFVKFMKKLKYKYPDAEYINIVEPQGRGAWHCHILLKFMDRQKIYIPNKEIRAMWGEGFVTVKKIDPKGVDNIGAYLTAYLTDMELTPENAQNCDLSGEVKTVIVDGKEKKYVKGARLKMYPTGMQIYRKSKGMEYPETEWMPYRDAKKITGRLNPSYSKTIQLYDDDEKMINSITYEYYNMKRQNVTTDIASDI